MFRNEMGYSLNTNAENGSHTVEHEKMRSSAEMVIGHPRAPRPDEKSFVKKFHNVEEYGEEAVRKDMFKVRKAEENFGTKKEVDVISEAFEITLIDLGQMAQWLGNAQIQRSSKFDDYFHGIDGTAEYAQGENAPQRLALVIDATIGKSAKGGSMETVQKKVKRNIEKVIKREVSMKYFKSAVDGYKGKLENIIPVVVGLEGTTANELIKLYAQILELKNIEPKSIEDEEKLAYKLRDAEKHPAQIIMLEQIKVQAQMYIGILEKLGPEYDGYLQEAIRLKEIFEKLLEEKSHIKTNGYESDNVLGAIKEIAKEKIEESK
jgi:hypothetical protein